MPGDAAWLSGYRQRANGKPKPTAPIEADGWSDLDALMQLIQAGARDRDRMQKEIDALKAKEHHGGY